MAGRIYQEPGEETDPELRAKRKALMAVNRKRKASETVYIAYPPPADPATVAAATSYIEKHAGEDAALILGMLGLREDQPLRAAS